MCMQCNETNTGVSVVVDSEVVFVNEMEGFVEICVNLTGQSEIDVPVILTTSNLTAKGTFMNLHEYD
jgi:hypothetical protein